METNNIINTVTIQESKEAYEAPVIEIIEVEVELGFADSLGTSPNDGGNDDSHTY